jgi:hypothetical protein
VSIVRWNLKEAGCEEHTNSRANLWSDEQKSHIRLCMRVRLQLKSKPDNYTESCMINEADGWRGRNVWYLGRSVRNALKGVTTVQGNEAVLNAQKSAEVIVAERRRTESIGVLSMTEKGGMTIHGRKH